MSYLVTLGFIIFILLFLSSLVFLSRLVLSQDSEFGTYVSSTQDLLKEIDRVQREVNNVSLEKNDQYLEFPSSLEVLDFSSLGVSGKSYITFTLNRPTFIHNSTLYYVPNSTRDFDDGDQLLLFSNESSYVMKRDSTLLFYNRDEKMFAQGKFEDIRGVVLYENR